MFRDELLQTKESKAFQENVMKFFSDGNQKDLGRRVSVGTFIYLLIQDTPTSLSQQITLIQNDEVLDIKIS